MSNKLVVQFNSRQQKAFDVMVDDLHTTKAGVLKLALSLLAVAVRERKEGNRIGVIKDEKIVKEIVGILDI